MRAMLTRRQAQILAMFCSGLTYREVAARLGLSPETINPSLKQSAKRLGASGIGREVLKAAALERGVSLDVAPPREPPPQSDVDLWMKRRS